MSPIISKVHRKEQGSDLLCPPQQLLATVVDEPLAVDVPQFAKDEIQKLADLIENKLPALRREEDVDLFINNAYIPINPFVKNLLARTLAAMVSRLKGVKEVKSLHISPRRKA